MLSGLDTGSLANLNNRNRVYKADIEISKRKNNNQIVSGISENTFMQSKSIQEDISFDDDEDQNEEDSSKIDNRISDERSVFRSFLTSQIRVNNGER